MRHRFERHDHLGLGLLSLIETLNLGVVPDGEVGGFDKRPGQILIAVLGIAFAFFLTVADLLTADTAAIRCEVADTGKSPNVSGLQHDGEREDLTDPRRRLEKAELGAKLDSLGDGLFEQLDLFVGARPDRQVGLDRQGEISIG